MYYDLLEPAKLLRCVHPPGASKSTCTKGLLWL